VSGRIDHIPNHGLLDEKSLPRRGNSHPPISIVITLGPGLHQHPISFSTFIRFGRESRWRLDELLPGQLPQIQGGLIAIIQDLVRLHTVVKVRLPGKALPADMLPETVDVGSENGARVPLITTTVGRLVLNQAFPDDMEFVAAGTLLRLQRAGYEIHCLAVANGCCGSSVYGPEETVSVRRAEAREACRLAGFTLHESLVNDFEVLYERSTLARIAALVGAPQTEIDGLYHGPGWTLRDSFMDDVAALVAEPAWVAEWQYGKARPLLLSRADLLVWLDLPRTVVIRRVAWRTLHRRLTRTVLWNGNLEPPLVTFFTDPDHIVRWAWRTHHESAQRVPAAAGSRPDLSVVRLTSQRQVDRWLAGPLLSAVRPTGAPPDASSP